MRFALSQVRPFAYPTRSAALHVDGVSLDALAKRYGTPLYVYSATHIQERFDLYERAFAAVPHLICYAVKANSALAILALLDKRGAGFDIVSGGELERVLTVNRQAAGRVVFSGVGKTAPEMDLALRAGILSFHVESEGELELLAERATKLRKRAAVSMRVNPDVFAETHPYISTGLREHKFGIDIARARKVYRKVKEHKWLEARGVSVHIGSQIRAAEPFGAAAEHVVALIAQLRKDGHAITHMDLGGGLGIDYGAATDFDAAAQMEQYAQQLLQAASRIPEITLLVEPGRFVVAQAGALVTRVLYRKKNGEKNFVIVDAGMNDLIRPALYQAHHEIVPVTVRRGAKKVVADVVGPVCETGDFFARDRELEGVREGDLLAILDAGAYGVSLSSNYNSRPRPAEVMVSGKRARVIRRRETMQDLLAVEQGWK